MGHGSAMVAWGCGCGWVLILRGVVVMETTPVEAWRSSFDGVLNEFFFDFLGVSVHGGGGCIVVVVVSLVVVAEGGFMVANVGFICVDFCFD